jgi:hypothetical protein
MDAISFWPIVRPVSKAKYRLIQSEWRFYPTTDYKSILPVSFKDSKWWSWVSGKSVSVFEPVSVAEDYLNPWRTKVFNCSSTDCIAVESCLLIISRDILVGLVSISSIRRYVSIDILRWQRSRHQKTSVFAEAVHHFIPVVVNGRISNYNCGVPLVKFRYEEGWPLLRCDSDRVRCESSHYWPTTPITTNWFDVQRRERCYRAGYKGRIYLIAFQF